MADQCADCLAGTGVVAVGKDTVTVITRGSFPASLAGGKKPKPKPIKKPKPRK